MDHISEVLRKRREEKRLSFETVNLKTRISIRYLRALEEGDPSSFPAEVYLIGTLRNYANFLGLNGNELVESYRNYVAEQKKTPPPAEEKKLHSNNAHVIFAAVLFVAIGIVVATMHLPSPRTTVPQPQSPAAGEPPVISSSTAEAAKPAVVPAAVKASVPQIHVSTSSLAGTEASKGLRLEVTIKETSWIRITADGVMVFSGTLSPGDSKTWTAQDKFYVSIGYVPGVSAKINGKEIDVTRGALKDVNQLILTREDTKS